MPAFSVDFTNVQTLNMAPLPAGEYYVQVVACKPKTSSTGKGMLEWQYRVVEGEYENRRVFQNTMMQPENLWKLKQNLIGLGFTEEDLGGNIELNPDELIGLECFAIVTQRDYQGQMRNNVDRLISLAEHQRSNGATEWIPPEVPEEAKVNWGIPEDVPFGENQNEGTAKATKAAIDARKAPVAVAAPPEEDDEDIEFEKEEAVAEVVLAPTKAATRLAETYNVELRSVYAHTGNVTVSRQDVLDYVATLAPAGEDEE